MAVPKRKTSRSKMKSRRNHKMIGSINLISCTNCGEKILTHVVCNHCGNYRGKEVISKD